MEQCFNIIMIETSMDMGIGNRRKSWIKIPCDDLLAGDVYEIYGYDLSVVSLNENEITFEYRGKSYVLNRYWQVLGTPEFGIPNERISIQGRYVFFFSKDPDIECDWTEDYSGELIDRINKNDGVLWKNIPHLQEIIHEFKDVAPFRSENINPVYKAHYISGLIENNYIEKKETPRLFQSFCELYRLYRDFEYMSDYDKYLNENFDKYYFRKVDNWIYKFGWIMDNPKSNIALDCWNGLGGTLKVDPVQATKEWEDNIYEVEKEVDEQLKDEPRGMGFCFSYWSAKKAALARRGIEWRSPSAMNPKVKFD